MSLEQKIEALTGAMLTLNATIAAQSNPAQFSGSAPVVPHQAQQATVPAAPSFAPAQAPVMPPPPSFMAPPAPAAPAMPFADTKGLIEYATKMYGALGAERGMGIQTAMTNLGYNNINDIKPEHFPAFYAAVEALKG